MLSRAAEGLFWLARSMERAENIARLLDAGRRLEALPSTPEAQASEWASIVVASGCSTTYPRPLEQAHRTSVLEHLVFDDDNPSSIRSCFRNARENARAMRPALSSEAWDAANDAWIAMRAKDLREVAGGGLAGFLDWVKAQGFAFRGAISATLLRNDGYDFIQIGHFVERADATARLLDVKYHVLLPEAHRVGGGLDYMQWSQVLRAANSRRAYRWVYHSDVTPDRVAHLLILNEQSPRALTFCYRQIVNHLDSLGRAYGQRHQCHRMATDQLGRLLDTDVDEIFAFGLHEWLTEIIIHTNRLAGQIALDYGFGWAPSPAPADGQGSVQS